MTGPAPGEEFFAGDETALAVYRSLASAIAPLAGVRVVVSRSQVADEIVGSERPWGAAIPVSASDRLLPVLRSP